MQYGDRNIHKFQIFEKKIQDFSKSENGLRWILRYERALKMGFLLTSLFFT